MLKPTTNSSANRIQRRQQIIHQIISGSSTPNSTTTQRTDRSSSILSPTSPNQINLPNFQINTTSQQQQDEFNNLLRQFSLVQMFEKQLQQTRNILVNDLLISNHLRLSEPDHNRNEYLNSNANQIMTRNEPTNLLLNNNNQLSKNNNIIGNTSSASSLSSNSLRFTNHSLLSINQHLDKPDSRSYNQRQSNLNSYQQSHLANTHQQINRIRVGCLRIVSRFGKLRESFECLSSPHGFCLGVNEEIVVADTFNHRICIFEKTGIFKQQFGLEGKDDGLLWYPRKVGLIISAINNSPRYVVCDRGTKSGRMQIFSKDGQFMHTIEIGYVGIVAGLAVTSDGLIVVVGSLLVSLFVIRENGEALYEIDCKEYITEPSDIAVFKDHFYICDFKGHCVVVFNSDGEFVRKIGNHEITHYPNGIDITNNGDIIIGDSHGNKFHIVVYSGDGEFLRESQCRSAKVSRCCGLKITKEGYIVTLAKNNNHVLILDALFNLINGQYNPKSMNSSSIQKQSFTNRTNQLLSFINNNNNSSTTSSKLLSVHNSSKEDIEFESMNALYAVVQNNLMNLLAFCHKSTTGGSNDSTLSDLSSSIIDSVATSPIQRSVRSSNLFLDSNISALQHRFNNNTNQHKNGSKVKNIMTIEHIFGNLGSGKGEFSSPHGFCIGHEDEIIIADTYEKYEC